MGKRHYDTGNDLFEAMLGKRLVYSCGYWAAADNLDAAQEAKLDLVCRKLQLKPGMRVLDIGCGWGEALKFAAERYGVSGVGITVSKAQAGVGRKTCVVDCRSRSGCRIIVKSARPSTRCIPSACSSMSAGATTAPISKACASVSTPDGLS
ncbi:Cyclopropane-fatty-acyl-phospholipid synthase, partial [mine drainage metagenome]